MTGRYLVAELGADRVGFHFDRAEEILEGPALSRVPWAPSWVAGALLHQGDIWTVVDLGRFLGLEESTVDAVVLVRGGEAPVAFGVTQTDLAESPRSGPTDLTLRRSEWVLGGLVSGELRFADLDLDAVLRDIFEAF